LRRADALLLAGIGGLGAGMVLVVTGVVVTGLFMPGVYVLVVAFVLLAVSGGVRVSARDPEPPVADRTRA
jgi:hypothetical protein